MLGLSEFNQAPPAKAAAVLSECLAVPRWIQLLVSTRPYADRDALLNAAREAANPLAADEIHRAIASHPRIGEQPKNGGTSAAWSRSEQSGVDDAVAERFRAANTEYEQRFGHVYLVCAAGRDGTELLADLRSRLGNDPETELAVAGAELAKIAVLRLEKAIS